MATLSERITEAAEGMKDWHQERVIFETTDRICELLEELQVSRTQFAKMLGKSKAYVTQLLDGQTNMTLRTISDTYLALGRAVHIQDSSATTENEVPCLLKYDGVAEWGRSDEPPQFSVRLKVK